MSEHWDRFMKHMAQTMTDEQYAAAFSPDGLAPTCDWKTEDGWLVSYTTKRIRAGKLDGTFAVFVYEPRGRGSRSGKAERWERVRVDTCDTRREAKQRALAFYYEHSPKAAARHGWTGEGYEEEEA
ncbi:MAG TPA: hypothetical protein VLI07_18745 [Candidatus Binatus sp.]|nr:hypothetical protein [Candidatus Binatus sp.]